MQQIAQTSIDGLDNQDEITQINAWKLMLAAPSLILHSGGKSRAGKRGQGHMTHTLLIQQRLDAADKGNWEDLFGAIEHTNTRERARR
jgi:hypothetical protein